MKVFISWSGTRSMKVATLLKTWLDSVIQTLDIFISPEMDRGTMWFPTIAKELADTSFGIICLTHENKLKPWVLFEAGALAKGLTQNHVCPFLIDLRPEDLDQPLSTFNATLPDKAGIRSLIITLNKNQPKPIKEASVTMTFEAMYPTFEEGFQQILKDTDDGKETPHKSTPEMLTEILLGVRSLQQEEVKKRELKFKEIEYDLWEATGTAQEMQKRMFSGGEKIAMELNGVIDEFRRQYKLAHGRYPSREEMLKAFMNQTNIKLKDD